jgi:hypothetical protein
VSAAGDRLQDTARKAALALPDVSHGRPFTPGLDVYKVADKVFLIVTDDPDDQIITVKREPEHARALERGYASITPGRFRDERCAGGGLGEGFGQGCGVAEGGVGAGPPTGFITHSCRITGDLTLLNSTLRTAAYLPVLGRPWLRLATPLFRNVAL